MLPPGFEREKRRAPVLSRCKRLSRIVSYARLALTGLLRIAVRFTWMARIPARRFLSDFPARNEAFLMWFVRIFRMPRNRGVNHHATQVQAFATCAGFQLLYFKSQRRVSLLAAIQLSTSLPTIGTSTTVTNAPPETSAAPKQRTFGVPQLIAAMLKSGGP